MTKMRRSYLMGNQMRLPKHLLYMGQAIVGIQVSTIKNPAIPIHTVVVHFPLGSNGCDLKARIAVSNPKIKVMYPMMKIAVSVSVQCRRGLYMAAYLEV
jgi:hypothetical protein